MAFKCLPSEEAETPNRTLVVSPTTFSSVPKVCKLEGLLLQLAAIHHVCSKTAVQSWHISMMLVVSDAFVGG